MSSTKVYRAALYGEVPFSTGNDILIPAKVAAFEINELTKVRDCTGNQLIGDCKESMIDKNKSAVCKCTTLPNNYSAGISLRNGVLMHDCPITSKNSNVNILTQLPTEIIIGEEYSILPNQIPIPVELRSILEDPLEAPNMSGKVFRMKNNVKTPVKDNDFKLIRYFCYELDLAAWNSTSIQIGGVNVQQRALSNDFTLIEDNNPIGHR